MALDDRDDLRMVYCDNAITFSIKFQDETYKSFTLPE